MKAFLVVIGAIAAIWFLGSMLDKREESLLNEECHELAFRWSDSYEEYLEMAGGSGVFGDCGLYPWKGRPYSDYKRYREGGVPPWEEDSSPEGVSSRSKPSARSDSILPTSCPRTKKAPSKEGASSSKASIQARRGG